jgi:vitamin B12/bleomycin/antimicrobial peptide transport system ATP-binding/permease protein
MMKNASVEEPDGLMKEKNRPGWYQHVAATDASVGKKNDEDLHHRFTSKANSDFENDRFPMETSFSSSISRNESRQSIHWSHVYEQIKSMFRIAVPYFHESKQSRWLVAGLFFFMALDNGASIVYSYVNRDIWNALAEQNVTKFYTCLVYFIVTLLMMAPIGAMYIYYQNQFALHWRAWLTTRTIQLYTSNQVYYNIEIGRSKEMHTEEPQDTGMGSIENRRLIDNPDQRITEDVEAFTRLSIQLCFQMFGTFIQLFSFAAILWTIYPQLLWIALVYSFGGTVVTTWLGHPLIQLNVEHLRREADLRYSLVRFRENAEAIAFYLSAAFLEQTALRSRLKHVVTNQYRINLITRTVYLFTFSYNLTRAFLPVVIMVRSQILQLVRFCMTKLLSHS